MHPWVCVCVWVEYSSRVKHPLKVQWVVGSIFFSGPIKLFRNPASTPQHMYCIICGMKEGNVLFNDTLNTFYLQLYGIGHMVKVQSDSEKKPAAATWATLSN